MRGAKILKVSEASVRLVGAGGLLGLVCAVLACVLAGPVARAGDECVPAWVEGFGVPGINDVVRTLTVFDDGSGGGPALYAGGRFITAGGVTVNRIARWDGSAWSALEGPGGVGVNNSVIALTVFDDGTGGGPALYVGGQFLTAGGVTVNRIARWDGSDWSALEGPGGVGVNGTVYALTVFDDGSGGGPALYAGGQFTTAGGVTVNCIARWDGSEWSALEGPGGVGVSGGSSLRVDALTVFDDGSGSGPALYAGGNFTTAGGMTVNRIARWDGTAWSALEGPGGVGVNNSVSALTVFDDGSGGGPALYAGGQFTTAGGVTVNRIARWDGSAWSALEGPGGVGVNNSVSALTVFDDGTGAALYTGGLFTSAGGATVNRIARWDGSDWTALSGSVGMGVDREIHALTVFDDGSGGGPALFAGGEFATAGGVWVSRVARWDGTAWSALAGSGGVGVSVDGTVNTLTVFDDGSGGGHALYVGGEFATAGGRTVNNIARWDGSEWLALETPDDVVGAAGGILALTVFDDRQGGGPALYAGGWFTTAGGVEVNGIARWDGSEWSALAGPGGVGVSGGSSPRVRALMVFDDGSGGGPALYAGGFFTTAGGMTANGIARWDGTAWSVLEGPSGVGVGSGFISVRALTVFDDGSGGGPALYAGGSFTTAGGVTVNGIARWDGSAWSALDSPGGVGVNGVFSPTINALKVFDDGAGPALYAGGEYLTAGGVLVNRIARWDGSAWSALAGPGSVGVSSGYDTVVRALAVFDERQGGGPALYCGGNFTLAGGSSANHIARWQGCPQPCPPDLTGDGILDLADIVAFIAAFIARDPIADFAEPFGVFDTADIAAFVAAFEAGCP